MVLRDERRLVIYAISNSSVYWYKGKLLLKSQLWGGGGGGRYFRDLVTAVKFRVPTFGGSSELYGLNKALYLHDRGYVLRLG